MNCTDMTIGVLGSGSREHVFVETLRMSPCVDHVRWIPGNGGAGKFGYPSPSLSYQDIIALGRGCDLVVCGPDAPIVDGTTDKLRAAGVPVVGPDAFGGQLEGSKIFTRRLGQSLHLPQPLFRIARNYREAAFIIDQTGFLVIKKDGLAAGKGVIVAHSKDEAKTAARLFFEKEREPILLEEKLIGRECSVIALCDGLNAVLFPAARDYKRAYDGDKGLNTGGMGAISPVPDVNDAMMERIRQNIFMPILRALQRMGKPYHGFLYAGIMLTATGPVLIEFNVRLGDPEAQVILTRLISDLVPYLVASLALGGLAQLPPLEVSPRAAVCVVLAAPGYPDTPRTGQSITGLDFLPADVGIYHGGTRMQDGKLLVSGGRVLSLVGMGDDLAQSREIVYDAESRVEFDGKWCRTDIGLLDLVA